MPSFGRTSSRRLETCDDRLFEVFEAVVEKYDCTILEGHRTTERQLELLAESKTTLGPGMSKHNRWPSLAVDVAPYHPTIPHVHWDEPKEWILFAGYVFRVADELSVPLRWGGDWNGSRTFEDQTFHDLPHWEIDE